MNRLQTFFADLFRQTDLAGRTVENTILCPGSQHVVYISALDIFHELVSRGRLENLPAAEGVFPLVGSVGQLDADQAEDFLYERQLVGDEAVRTGTLVGGFDIKRSDSVL